MLDLLMLILMVTGFAGAAAYVAFCRVLAGYEQPPDSRVP
jgi:hypothetical protein